MDIDLLRDIQAGFWGLIPSSKLFEFDQIESSIMHEHRFLIHNRELIEKIVEINWYMEWLQSHNEAHSKIISELKDRYKTDIRFEDEVETPNVQMITGSNLFYNAMSDILQIREVKFNGSKQVLQLMEEMNKLILSEIKAQEEAMKGIF